MATIASAERLREAFQIPFRKDYFLGKGGWYASSGKNADGIPNWWYFGSAIIMKAMLELMAKERGDSRRTEAERGPSVLVVILAIGIGLAALVLCFIWFLFFGM
jgi:hypothetical protein